ncbi:MAG: hypothetical protein ABFD91_10425 [Anaerohalosphaeraceae bacterium]
MIAIVTFIFFLGFLAGRFVREWQRDHFPIEQNYHFVQSLPMIDHGLNISSEEYRINIYEESSWEIGPCYQYQIIDMKSFKPTLDDPFKTPEFILVGSSNLPMAAVVTKDCPREILIMYDSETLEYCDNRSTDNEEVIKTMLWKFCRQMNDYSYFMESEKGIIKINPNEKNEKDIQ